MVQTRPVSWDIIDGSIVRKMTGTDGRKKCQHDETELDIERGNESSQVDYGTMTTR